MPNSLSRRGTAMLAIGLAASLGVAACGSSKKSGGSAGGGKNYKMTLIAGVKGDEFYITMNCGAQAQAKKLGVSLNFQGPDQFDPSLQTPVVNAVAAKKPDAVLVAPTDSKAMFAPINALKTNGSKVVLVDTTLNVKPGISTTDLRAKGFADEAKKLGLTYVGQQFDNDDPARASSIVTAELARYPDLKGIFATNLFSAEGSASGLRSAGKLSKVKIVGFDAGPKQVKDLKEGVVQGLIAQRPAQIGADGVQQAFNALNGKPVEKKIGTGFVSLTKSNLSENQDALYKSRC